MLVHHADARINCLGRIAEDALLAVYKDFSGVGSIETREDVHQGGLTCAVLTEKAEHLALVNRDGDSVVRQNARELLCNLLQFEPHATGTLPTLPLGSLLDIYRPGAEAPGRRVTTSSPKRWRSTYFFA